MEKPVIKITAYVDTVCPWCYIGKKHMERAIKEYSDQATFEIVYETYWLNQPGDIPEGILYVTKIQEE
jgi:predicted DsbA family dithiol-disulfide isomerase